MNRILQIIIFTLALTCCSGPDKLLNGHDFDKGDWLLVNVNYAEKTLQLIDDETILKNNKNGIWVSPAGDCDGTTCDGFLMLYKDGRLIAQDEYLTRSTLYESTKIKESYKKAVEWTIDPINNSKFKQLWDSLKNAGNYPTIYHAQPADKNIIWVYRIEEK